MKKLPRKAAKGEKGINTPTSPFGPKCNGFALECNATGFFTSPAFLLSAAANSENPPPGEQTEQFSAPSAANAIAVELVDPADGWMRLSRYGRHPHAGVRKVQIFEKAQAETLVSAFRSTLTRLKQRLLGAGNPVFERRLRLPIYEGHPDAPGFAGEPGHDDHTPYGHVEDLQARDDGLYAKIEWTAAGNALRAAGRKLYFSPYWTLFSRKENPGQAYPMRLLSVGMHERVNISGSAANAATPPHHQNPQPNKTMLKKLLIALGFAEAQAEAAANGAEGAPSETEAVASISALRDRSNDTDQLRNDLATANARVTSERTAHDKTRHSLAAANTSVEAERTARADLVLDRAVSEGRLPEAERTAERTTLIGAEDFAAAANAVLEKKPKLKTKAAANVEGQREAGERLSAANASVSLREKARTIFAANGRKNWDASWNQAKRENPELVAAMAAADEEEGGE